MNAKRKKAEQIVYDVMNALDKTGANAEYYKKKFAKMNDKEFLKFISLKFPYRFQTRVFKIEPTMVDVYDAAKIIDCPITEKVRLPYLYTDKDGNPVSTKECLVVYSSLKKVKQFISKKNSMSVDIDMRDNKTGLLISQDKNGKTSDREMESLAVMGLTQTMRELSRPRADAMEAKSAMYSTISTNGAVSLKELPDAPDDSIAKNLLNVYLLGAGLDSNLLNREGMLPITYKNRQRSTRREEE